MLNMIKLDWLGMKTYHYVLLLAPLLIYLFGGFMGGWLYIPLAALLMWGGALSPFFVEEKGDLNYLYLTLPIHRKAIVRARFGLSLFLVLAGIVLGIALTIVNSFLYSGQSMLPGVFQPTFDSIFLLVCVGLFIYALLLLCSFPILFKLGYAKGQFFGYYVPLCLGGVLLITLALLPFFVQPYDMGLLSTLEWVMGSPLWVALVILAFAVVFFTFSYLLSQKAFAKREL